MKKLYILLTFIMCFAMVMPVWAETSSTGSTNENNTVSSPIESVDPNVFVQKIANGLMSIYESINIVIIPLGALMIGILSIVFIIGSLLGLRALKTIGGLGVVFCLFGVFLFKIAPILTSIVFHSGENLMK